MCITMKKRDLEIEHEIVWELKELQIRPARFQIWPRLLLGADVSCLVMAFKVWRCRTNPRRHAA